MSSILAVHVRRGGIVSTTCRRFSSFPDTMQAVQVGPPLNGAKRPGPDCLICESVPVPQPRPNEVLIKVAAAGVNRPDVMQRLGLYAPPRGHSTILGLEVAGEVVAVGSGVDCHAIGDRVCALANGGGYAEFCAAPQGQVLQVPKGMDMTEAAAIPETFFTVWYNLFKQTNVFGARLFEKEQPSILVHGGSSGIGTTAIQLAKAFSAKHIIATAGSDAKCDACMKLGATRALNYKGEDGFLKAVLDETGGKGVDLVLDMVVGKGYTQNNVDALKHGGRLSIIGFLGGAKVDLNMTGILTKGLSISGSTLRTLDDESKASIAQDLKFKVWPLLESGQIKPQVDSVFKLSDAAAAHKRMEGSDHIGKICLTMN